MNTLKLSALAAFASANLTAGALYYCHHRQTEEAATLRSANNQMHYAATQRLHRTAAEITPDRDRRAKVTPAAPAPAPLMDYRNEGQGTPLATLQTFAWTCDRRDAAGLEKLICFDPIALEKAKAFRAVQPAPIRDQWHSPEAMAAALLTADAVEHPFPSAAILAKATAESITADRVRLNLPGTGRFKENSEYQKSGVQWRYVITEAMVDDYIERASLPPPGA